MTESQSNNAVARFFGAALMAVGGLIAVLSGLCSVGFLGFMAYATFSGGSGNVSGREIPAMVASVLSLIAMDAIPVGLGVAMFLWGRSIRRGRSS